MAEVVTRIEPRSKSARLAGGCFPETELRLASYLESVIRNRQNCCNEVFFIFAKDLDDVPVRLGVSQFENVLAGLQHFLRNLHRRIDGYDGFLVPSVGSGLRDQPGNYKRGAGN